MKLCLIYPSLTVYNNDSTTLQVRPPLGLLSVAAVCEQHGHDVSLYDCLAEGFGKSSADEEGGITYGADADDIAMFLSTFKPEVVGISAMFSAFSKDAHDAAAAVKKWNPDVPVILGGMHASSLPEDVLKDPDVDYVVIGEGERTIIELLGVISTGSSVDTVKGIAFKHPSNGLTITEPRERIRDLDSLPLPSRHLIDLEFYSSVAENEPDNYIMRHPYTTIYTSRGCPGKCIYCAAHNIWRNRWIPRSANHVLDEIEYLVNTYGIREVHFLDDNASVNKKRFMELCQGLIERKLDISWSCPTGLAIWTLDEEMLRLMKRAGCYKLCFGIESGHPDTLQFIRKKLDLEQVKRIIKVASNLGFWIQSTYIIGFPYETEKQIDSTINYAISTYSDFVNFLLLIPYPGTEVYAILKQEKLLPHEVYDYKNLGKMMTGFSTMVRNKNLTANELNDLFDLAFRKLVIERIKLYFMNPSILLKKVQNVESLKFFLRIVFNFAGVLSVVFLKGVTKAGTLKPSYTNKFSKKSAKNP